MNKTEITAQMKTNVGADGYVSPYDFYALFYGEAIYNSLFLLSLCLVFRRNDLRYLFRRFPAVVLKPLFDNGI